MAAAANDRVETTAHFSGPKAAQPKGSKTSTPPTTGPRRSHERRTTSRARSNLSEMQAIVAGDHPKAQVEALRPALAVDPEPGSLFGPAPLPQRNVGFAEGIEQFDQVLHRVVFIVELARPTGPGRIPREEVRPGRESSGSDRSL